MRVTRATLSFLSTASGIFTSVAACDPPPDEAGALAVTFGCSEEQAVPMSNSRLEAARAIVRLIDIEGSFREGVGMQHEM